MYGRNKEYPDGTCPESATWFYMGIGFSADFCDTHAEPFKPFIKAHRYAHWTEYLKPIQQEDS